MMQFMVSSLDKIFSFVYVSGFFAHKLLRVGYNSLLTQSRVMNLSAFSYGKKVVQLV